MTDVFFSLEITESFVARRLARSQSHLTIPRFTDCGWLPAYAGSEAAVTFPLKQRCQGRRVCCYSLSPW